MSLTFVNIHGDPVSLAPPAKTRKARPEAQARHDGFFAMGISPETLQDAAEKHGDDFNESHYLRTAKPTKITNRAYTSHETATVACTIARKAGWRQVHVLEKRKD